MKNICQYSLVLEDSYSMKAGFQWNWMGLSQNSVSGAIKIKGSNWLRARSQIWELHCGK
jgi:hypothetical protein